MHFSEHQEDYQEKKYDLQKGQSLSGNVTWTDTGCLETQ